MTTKNPRVQVVLEKPLYDRVRKLAKRDGLSLSMEIRSLVREAAAVYSIARKPYDGKHSVQWVGAYGSGSGRADIDGILAEQVHG